MSPRRGSEVPPCGTVIADRGAVMLVTSLPGDAREFSGFFSRVHRGSSFSRGWPFSWAAKLHGWKACAAVSVALEPRGCRGVGGHPPQSPSHTENAVLVAEELADKSPVVVGNHLYFHNLQSVYIQLSRISRLSIQNKHTWA